MDIEKYVQHLSGLSNPNFHRSTIVLVLYNIFCKQKMLKHTGWRVRNQPAMQSPLASVTAKEVEDTLLGKSDTNGTTTKAGIRFVDLVR